MPTHDSMKPGKRIVSGAVAGILAVSMTPAMALAEEPVEQDTQTASASQELGNEGQTAIEDTEEAPLAEDAADASDLEAVSEDDALEAVEGVDESFEEAVTPEEEAESEEVLDVTDEAIEDEEAAEEAEEAAEPEQKLGVQAAAILQTAGNVDYDLNEGINVCKESASNTNFNVSEGQALMLSGTEEAPLVFSDCVFNLSGATITLSGNYGFKYDSGETITKLFVGNYVTFKNCTFIADGNFGASSSSTAGYDACIYLWGDKVDFYKCSITGQNYLGQFMGLYGASNVTFDDSHVSTVGNTGGWSYAMYGNSVLTLNNSAMTATGMQPKLNGGSLNAFYSGDKRTIYDAIFVNKSTIDFSDNNGGGFAINNAKINIKNSTINVANNAGNACNSGYWIVNNSDINMSGNKAHGWSCSGFEMTGGSLNVLHNGYAGIYVQSLDSVLNGTNVRVMCNGERLLNYSAGDVWLDNYKSLTLKDCKKAWLGAIGIPSFKLWGTIPDRGSLITDNSPNLVAYDLFGNALKNSGYSGAIIGEGVTLGGRDEHYLFLNPELDFDYARGNDESTSAKQYFNDSDLFKQTGITDRMQVIGPDAKIGSLTTAQLSHHSYDWEKGELTDEASPKAYGVIRYACTGACDDHAGRTKEHPTSFDCNGTYVYAPVVGVAFDTVPPKGATSKVQGMPKAQTKIMYKGCAKRPADPTLEGYVFTGWYADAECTIPVDFTEAYTNNWTVLYAGWEKAPEPVVPDEPDTPVVPDEQESVAPAAGSSTMVASYEVEQTQGSELPQSGDRSLQTVAVSLASLVAAAFTAVFAHRRRRS